MKPSEVRQVLAEEEEFDGEDGFFDEDDFLRAIDLLVDARRCMLAVLRNGGRAFAARQAIMDSMCDEIGDFVEEFVVPEHAGDTAVEVREEEK